MVTYLQNVSEGMECTILSQEIANRIRNKKGGREGRSRSYFYSKDLVGEKPRQKLAGYNRQVAPGRDGKSGSQKTGIAVL